ncbi:MAG: acetyltransferase [Nitrospiraceae bacterium]|nr:acetyltransferase [Nitrospiraceae bacterium]
MKIVVYGAGGHAKVVLDVLEKVGACTIVGLLDESVELAGDTRSGYRVLGGSAIFRGLIDEGVKGMIVALGDNVRRRAVFEAARVAGFELVSAIHPSVILGRGVTIGAGSVLVAGVVVNVDAEIGENVIVNTSASVDHDCRIGGHVHLSPGVRLAGRVTVGAFTHIGIGAVVLPNLTIGTRCIVGAGSVVRENVPDGMVVAGNPARIIKPNETALDL